MTPCGFNYPIPDTRTLADELWRQPSEMVGIDIEDEAQKRLLSTFSAKYGEEYDGFPCEKTAVPYHYYLKNPGFPPVDGAILYCMIRHFKPRRIIEVGSGFSTFVSAQAILKNSEEGGHDCELTAIEPYPVDMVKAGFPGLSRLIQEKVQHVPMTEFSGLQADDILFIDSSHVLSIGSDVEYEYLEIIPRLKKGTLVHVHDIFMPCQYPREWVLEQRRFWNEQYLFQAFLAFNDCFKTVWAGNYMNMKYPECLRDAFSCYGGNRGAPASYWMRRTG